MTSSRPTTGIEAITVHVPEHFLHLDALAAAHSVDPKKFRLGLGCNRMAVPHPTQDTVTMAVSAARDLLERYNVSPDDVGLLIVGTETGVDSSKPVGSYVHGLAGLGSATRVFDIKHACYGATAGLRLATHWALATGRKALVIAADVARYRPGSPGEPTQGAGAVAMLVSDRPSVLRLDDSFESVHALSVNDFWRPTYSPTAVVEGHYSVACYLSGLRSTWRTMASATSRTRDDFGYMLFHLPFPRIAWKAHVALAEIASGIDPGSRDDLEAERPVFEAKVEPALWASSEIGNIYTGSLWLSLAALLESEPAVSAGKLISLYSYGSGSCSELLTGRVGDDPTAWHGRIGLATALSSRIEIDHDLYIAFRSAELELRKNGSYVPGRVPLEEHVPSGTHSLFLGVRDHMRVYRPGAGWRPSVEPRVQIREDEPPEAWCDMWMLGQEPPWKVR